MFVRMFVHGVFFSLFVASCTGKIVSGKLRKLLALKLDGPRLDLRCKPVGNNMKQLKVCHGVSNVNV